MPSKPVKPAPVDLAAAMAARRAEMVENKRRLKMTPAEKLEAVRKREFPLGPTRTLKVHSLREKEQRKSRAAVRTLVRAENGKILADALPEMEGDHTHALIPGDFEFCDFLSILINRVGNPEELHLTSLSLSLENARELDRLCRAFPDCRFSLAISYFFRSTNKDIFSALETRLGKAGNMRFSTGRLHCKLVLLKAAGRHLVIETSANLRACRNLEHVTIFDDPQVYAFHAEWLEEFHTLAESGGFEHMISFSKK